MKTPEQLATEFMLSVDVAKTETLFTRHKKHDEMVDIVNSHGNQRMRLQEGFFAGYQAAKDQQRKEWETLVSKGKIAMQTLNDQLADADKVIPDTCEHILDMEKMVDVSSSVTLNNWISVKDRLPEHNTYVLVTDGSEVHRSKVWEEFFDMGPVTHWMPLPKPPEE